MPGVAHAHQTSNSAGNCHMCALSSKLLSVPVHLEVLWTSSLRRAADALQLSKRSAGWSVQASWSCKPPEYLSGSKHSRLSG